MRTTQKVYSSVITTIVGLSTFAAGLTFVTQFVITCPGSRLQVLLGMASQLFLASLLGVMVVFFLLYGIPEETFIAGTWHILVVIQFGLVGLMEIAAFLLLSVAILVAGNLVTGVWGLVLISVMIIGTIVVGGTVIWPPDVVGATVNWPPGTGESCETPPEIAPEKKTAITKEMTRIRVAAVFVLFAFEVVALGLLLGYGAQAASDANPQWGCVGNDSFAAHKESMMKASAT